MGVPFVDLKAQYHSIKAEIDAALLGTMESCAFTLGPEVAALEKEFAPYAGTTYAAGVNNGTNALYLPLLAAGIGPGDEVITVPFTFIASASAIAYTGATPVFVDIDPVTFTMDPAAIEAAITPRTKAIVPVHLFGQMADMDAIMAIAKKHNLFVLEDAAQAHGAEYNGKRAGAFGDATGFSFYPGKNLGAAGEGGMTVTPHAEINRKVRMLRDWGAEKKYFHEIIGYNMRLEGMQGAVLRVKMKYIEKWTEMRRDAAERYRTMFEGTGVKTPVALANRRHVYHIYAVRTPNRARWQEELTKKGIQTGIHYPFPLHTLQAFEYLGYKQGQFPHAEKAAAEVLSLPMYPELQAVQQEEVVAAVAALQKEELALA
ncbi:MAG: DegT/DnrJ/EryC1/StrS family aminotransferase [Hyphomonadaceae bacterium]